MKRQTPHGWRRSAIAIGVAVALGSSTVAGATTIEETHESPDMAALVDQTTDALSQQDSTSAESVSTTPTQEGGLIATSDSGSVLEVPSEPADGVALTSADGTEMKLGLPSAASDGVTVEGSTVFAEAAPSTDLVVTPIENGAAVLINIESADAPTEFSFPLSIPTGGNLTETDDGGVSVLDAEGSVVSIVKPPWARDAAGVAVPTRFDIRGNQLIQHVNHQEGMAYPVVADPAWFAPVAWWVAKRVVASWAIKKYLERRGYTCYRFQPPFLCTLPVY